MGDAEVNVLANKERMILSLSAVRDVPIAIRMNHRTTCSIPYQPSQNKKGKEFIFPLCSKRRPDSYQDEPPNYLFKPLSTFPKQKRERIYLSLI